MKYLLFPILIAFCFCTKKPKEEPICIGCGVLPPIQYHFVHSYCLANGIKLTNSDNVLTSKITTSKCYSIEDRIPQFEPDSFRFYSDKYRDATPYELKNHEYMILTDTIDNLSIITKHNLNDNHKAGDTINDIVQIKYTSVYDYVRTRYKGDIFLNTSLTEFNSKQRLMVKAEEMQLVLPTISPKPAKEQYEVRIRFASGKVISDTTELITN